MAGWKSAAKGIRYREHPTRKHGKKPDKYFALQYKLRGAVKNEGIGWASDGWTLAKCEELLATLRANWKTGGAQTLAELREETNAAAAAEKAQAAQEQALTLPALFAGAYSAAQHDKGASARRNEHAVMEYHIKPFFGDTPLKDINLNKIDAFLSYLKGKKSERTGRPLAAASLRHALALVRQIWNFAYNRGMIDAPCPVQRVKKPAADNRRMRFLTHDEARALLDALRQKSEDVYGIALVSLLTGMRLGEILGLQWADIDLQNGLILIRDPKNGTNRYSYMTAEVADCLRERFTGQRADAYCFASQDGMRRAELSKTFTRVVQQLGLNDGITDPRQRIVFHSLRHTCASWLVQSGVPLYDVAAVLGHKSITMTQRYAHLAPAGLKAAALTLQGALDEKAGAKVLPFTSHRTA